MVKPTEVTLPQNGVNIPFHDKKIGSDSTVKRIQKHIKLNIKHLLEENIISKTLQIKSTANCNW